MACSILKMKSVSDIDRLQGQEKFFVILWYIDQKSLAKYFSVFLQ